MSNNSDQVQQLWQRPRAECDIDLVQKPQMLSTILVSPHLLPPTPPTEYGRSGLTAPDVFFCFIFIPPLEIDRFVESSSRLNTSFPSKAELTHDIYDDWTVQVHRNEKASILSGYVSGSTRHFNSREVLIGNYRTCELNWQHHRYSNMHASLRFKQLNYQLKGD